MHVARGLVGTMCVVLALSCLSCSNGEGASPSSADLREERLKCSLEVVVRDALRLHVGLEDELLSSHVVAISQQTANSVPVYRDPRVEWERQPQYIQMEKPVYHGYVGVLAQDGRNFRVHAFMGDGEEDRWQVDRIETMYHSAAGGNAYVWDTIWHPAALVPD